MSSKQRKHKKANTILLGLLLHLFHCSFPPWYTFGNLLINYPDTKEGEFIRFMVIKSTFKYAQQSILAKQAERFEETTGLSQKFKKKYSESKFIKEVESIYETDNNKIKKIRNEY